MGKSRSGRERCAQLAPELVPGLAMAGEVGREARAGCLVVVVGDQGTGKSSLIIALATDSFPEKPPPVLPPTRLPPDFYPDRVPLTIVDTSSRFPLLTSLCKNFLFAFLGHQCLVPHSCVLSWDARSD